MTTPSYAEALGRLSEASQPQAPPEALTAMTRAFADLGTQALADRRGRDGKRWGVWADWCWGNQLPTLGATATAARQFFEDTCDELDDADAVLRICAVVTRRHLDAGYPDPWGQ